MKERNVSARLMTIAIISTCITLCGLACLIKIETSINYSNTFFHYMMDSTFLLPIVILILTMAFISCVSRYRITISPKANLFITVFAITAFLGVIISQMIAFIKPPESSHGEMALIDYYLMRDSLIMKLYLLYIPSLVLACASWLYYAAHKGDKGHSIAHTGCLKITLLILPISLIPIVLIVLFYAESLRLPKLIIMHSITYIGYYIILALMARKARNLKSIQ